MAVWAWIIPYRSVYIHRTPYTDNLFTYYYIAIATHWKIVFNLHFINILFFDSMPIRLRFQSISVSNRTHKLSIGSQFAGENFINFDHKLCIFLLAGIGLHWCQYVMRFNSFIRLLINYKWMCALNINGNAYYMRENLIIQIIIFVRN